ncbi:MAG: TetR/AcrR family transcriptional regulator [Acidimicrobiia bacterium]
MPAPAEPKRGRGRPRRSDGPSTSSVLLDAATEVCAERGFDGSTLGEIARRAQVSPTAVYNHYDSRETLLYAAAVRGLERISTVARQLATPLTASALAAAYLQPELHQTRRLLAELHLASGRDEQLAVLLADWHRRMAELFERGISPDDPAPRATVKVLFLLLLGLCHVDDLPAIRVPKSALSARVAALADHLVPPPIG